MAMHHANVWDPNMDGVEGQEEVIEGEDGEEYQVRKRRRRSDLN